MTSPLPLLSERHTAPGQAADDLTRSADFVSLQDTLARIEALKQDGNQAGAEQVCTAALEHISSAELLAAHAALARDRGDH